jgi:hypothetical protein
MANLVVVDGGAWPGGLVAVAGPFTVGSCGFVPRTDLPALVRGQATAAGIPVAPTRLVEAV